MMEKANSVDAILDFAIEREQESYEFYTNLAQVVEKSEMRQVFERFAKEEQGHKEKLLGIKRGKVMLPAAKKIVDLKIADYVVDIEINSDMDYQQALIVAMKKEKAAFRLYTNLASIVDDPNLSTVFQALAQEEAKHKLRFEIEYDDNILSEN
jgi:rubrerythrin